MVEIGFFALCFGFCLSLFGFTLGLFALQNPLLGILASAKNAFIAVFICVSFASVILWNALFFHDFSVKYVFKNSAADLPPLYLLSSFWSSLEGSHLLWTLLLSGTIALALVMVRQENQFLFPGLCVAFGAILCFMLFLNITFSPPLERFFPVGTFGQGMNALLQNPYMASHPPLLFVGYSLLVVPFAYSFSALVHKSLTKGWFLSVRRWSLLAWSFLIAAIFLGGKWAYVELGWAGYWAWDPVENSSFMPWLAVTAALHTLLVTKKTGRFLNLLLFLNMLAFAFSYLGTFITRSGIISSVHSFAESNIGPSYLVWVSFLFFLTVTLVFTRGRYLGNDFSGSSLLSFLSEKSQRSSFFISGRFSKENALLFTIFFVLFLFTLVFIGTILPLVVEAIQGIKISIQQPFFNAFAPWIGAGLVSLVGFGNLVRWKNGKIEDPLTCLFFPFLWAIPLTAVLSIQKNLDFKSILIFFIVIWSSGILILDLVYKLKNMQWNGKSFLRHNRGYLGAFCIHIGFLVAVAGFSGNYRGASAQVSLHLNQSTTFYGYTMTNEGLGYQRDYNAQFVVAKLKTRDDKTGEQFLITPMRSKFSHDEQWFNEIGIHSTWWHDLYVVLTFFDPQNESVSLKLSWNPLVKLVWTSVVMMIFGAFVSLTQHFDLSKVWQKKEPSQSLKKISSFFILFFLFAMTLFTFSGICYGQENILKKTNFVSQNVPAISDDSQLADVAKELRCPTCQGLSILESDTLQSKAMRTEIESQLDLGKTKKEIIDYFKKSYGPWILREPDSHSFVGFLIWFIPILIFVLGPLAIFVFFKNFKKKEIDIRNKLREEIKTFIQEKKTENHL